MFRHLLFLLVASSGLACGASPTGPGFSLAELVTVADQGLSTDLILPPLQGSLDLLGDGWQGTSSDGAQTQGLWVEGDTAQFRFYAALAGSLTLDVEAHALATDSQRQSVEVALNGQVVHRESMSVRWTRYEWPLPAESIEVGWNVVTLSFVQALRPSDLDLGNRDTRRLAARFRRLRVRSPFDRGLWADRPAVVTVSPSFTTHDEPVTIRMPTDSHLDFYLVAEEDTVLTGVVDAVPAAHGQDLEVWGSIELAEESGSTQQLVDYERSGPESSFAIDLGPWAHRPVRLRLRSWGRTNGTIRWHDLTVSAPADPTVSSAVPRSQLLVPPASGRLGKPDVIIVVLDAARADAFEQGPSQTPHTDALAADGTRFLRARAPAPWTGQSIPALLTGRYSGAIGAERWGSQLPDGVPTLAELTETAGYDSVLWSQHNIYSGNRSLRRGFETFEEVRSNVLADRSLLPSEDVLFLPDRPTLAVVHLLPPHGPYEPPPRFRGSLSAWYEGDYPTSAASLNRAPLATDRTPTDEDIRFVRSRYDENVQFADHLVGQLVETVRDAGRYDDALIVVTSDHGEAFFEHGRFLHTRFLYDEFLRIPMVVKWPSTMNGFAPAVDTVVSLVDLAPTLADGLALDLAEGVGFQGRTFLPATFDGEKADWPVFAQTQGVASATARPRPSQALVGNRYKLIRDELSGETELFDLLADPAEQTPLNASQPILAAYQLQQLQLQRQRNLVTRAEHVQQPEQELDEESIRRLRALGYVR